jgi:outer membrane protein OmpA-like peptidoglycan-associated protein
MKNFQFIPLALTAFALLSGCNSTTHNASLRDAHIIYDTARSDPDVTTLAAFELKEASDTLTRADQALHQGEDAATVNQMSYLAAQQVAIAQETAKRKVAEMAIADARATRTQVSLEARTAEADASKKQVVSMQITAAQQAEELAAANANALSDQALIDKQAQQLGELNARQTERGMVITLGDVLFNTNQSKLKAGGLLSMQKLADFLNQYPQHNVLVEGYTDSIGDESYNQQLSEQRANNVRLALVDDLGIGSARITTRGYGEEFPVADNDTAAGRQQNRRVEIIISDGNGKISLR